MAQTPYQTQDIADAFSNGFQAFVDQSNLISVPNTTIVGRAQIVDLSKDLKPRMGVDRISVQQIVELQNELGPNGERVFGALNDDRGLIRFVGNWSNYVSSDNPSSPITFTSGDYVEITFYGTGLNILTLLDTTVRDIRVSTASLNGGAEGSNITPASYSTVLSGRNYHHNKVVAAVSGLTLGIHTVKIRLANAQNFLPSGFEIINASSNINVNPGSTINGAKKLTSPTQSLLPYNSGFESGTLGTRGGRVVVYQKSDGTIAKSVQPVNAAQANLSSADHSNEEIARTYHWREFGAGRADDFSTLVASASSRAFTLEDGTTTLVGQNAISWGASGDGIYTSTNDFITFTFVGTGLDIRTGYTGTVDSHSILIDGTSIGSITASSGGTIKIVSGLPYGTHTLKILRTANAVAAPMVRQFIVYQPKKPVLPSGAVELADYNVMADYVFASTASNERSIVSTGVLRKVNHREAVHVGTWTNNAIDLNNWRDGISTFTAASGAYVEYTFFGTGFELFAYSSSVQNNATLQIDGANYTGPATQSTAIAGGGWTPGTSTWLLPQSLMSKLVVTGLTLGVHKLRLTKATATDSMGFTGVDAITPIHSHRSDLADIQNTLPVGSQGISDNRKSTSLKDVAASQKAWAQAVGITSSPTTTGSVFVPVPDLSVTIKTSGGKLDVSWFSTFYTSVANSNVQATIFVNGVQVGKTIQGQTVTANNTVFTIGQRLLVPVAAGFHKVDIYWIATGGSTGTAQNDFRSLTVLEI